MNDKLQNVSRNLRVVSLCTFVSRVFGLLRDQAMGAVVLGEEPAAVALAWLLHQDGVTCPIIGPRTIGQFDGASLRALDVSLTADTLTAIDAIFPGPGGTAPEAYAW